MRLLVSALFAFSLPALAATPLDRYLGFIGQASMEGDRVDVPLYHGPTGSTAPHVKVTIGDDEYLMVLGTNVSGVYVSERVAKEQELKVKTGNKKIVNLKGKKGKFHTGGEQKNAVLAEMKIGGLTLVDVNVSTAERDIEAERLAQRSRFHARSRSSGIALDGYIGLNALPEGISWAVLPSQGVVSFSAQGQDLIADGLELPYETTESEMFRTGRWYEPKKYKKAKTLIQGFSVSGVEMQGAIAIESSGSLQMWPEVVPTDIRFRMGDLSIGHHEVSHGSLSLGAAGVVELTSPAHRISISGQHWDHHVMIGQNLLAGFDIAADRTAKNFILKKADKVKRESPLSFMIAQVQKTIETADEAEPSQEAEAATESTEATADEAEPEVDGTAKDWGMLLDLHYAAGDFDAAIEAGKNTVALDDSDCTEWSRLGWAYREAGDISEAIVAYEKSASIYHGWYDLPLEEREEIKKELDKLEGEEKENSEYNVAAPNCHTADGALASLTFATGDLSTVGDIYRDRMDLDTTVALAAGTALVVQGQFDQAQGPLRQALKQGRGSQAMAMTRLALAGAYNGKGDWTTASKLFERALETNGSVQTVTYYLDALSVNEGHAAAVATAKALVAQYPMGTGAVYGLGHVALQGDDEVLQLTAKEAGDQLFAAKIAVAPHSAQYAGVRARWMTLWDASAIASQKAVRGALAKDPANTDALLAKAAIHTAKGEAEEAQKATMKAAQLEITHIGYAELMSPLSQ